MSLEQGRSCGSGLSLLTRVLGVMAATLLLCEVVCAQPLAPPNTVGRSIPDWMGKLFVAFVGAAIVGMIFLRIGDAIAERFPSWERACNIVGVGSGLVTGIFIVCAL
jgi:hypothetical protein